MNNDKLNLFQVVNKLENKEPLTLQEKRIKENAINKAKEFGYNATSQYNFELRSLISPDWQKSDTYWRAKDNDIQTLLNSVTLLENFKNSIKFPYNEFNVVWGVPSNDHETGNAKLPLL